METFFGGAAIDPGPEVPAFLFLNPREPTTYLQGQVLWVTWITAQGIDVANVSIEFSEDAPSRLVAVMVTDLNNTVCEPGEGSAQRTSLMPSFCRCGIRVACL